MSQFSDLQTEVSIALRDPSKVTFKDADLADMVNTALVEIGRIAPQRFQSDVTTVADATQYKLLAATNDPAIPEIEVVRVELWDYSVTPHRPVLQIDPADGEYSTWSEVGWKVWDGVLYLPTWVASYVKGRESSYRLRVWGYAPYTPLTTSNTVAISPERVKAIVAYCKVEALTRLVFDRDLFSQWQTRSSNTDVSPASLMNNLTIAQADWRRRERALQVLREAAS